MNKAELIEACAKEGKCPKRLCEAGWKVFCKVVGRTLAKGEDINIARVGKLYVKKRPAHKGVNPATGKPITIKASKTVAFKPAKGFKASI